MGNEVAALIFNILKQVSSTFELEKLLYNTVIIKMPQNYSQFFIQPNIPSIIDAPLLMPYYRIA